MKYLLILMLTGCAVQPQILRNDSKTSEQAQRDTMECRYDALKVEASVQNAAMGVFAGRDAMKMCLAMRGYK